MDIYKKNIKALKKRHPDLAEMIEAIIVDEDRIKVLYAETGEPRLLYKREDGEEIFIHSAVDPVKNANEAADIVDELGDEGVLIMFGFGLGYFAEESLKRFGKSHALIIYEAVPEILKVALQLRDLSSLFEAEKVNLIAGENPNNLSVIHDYYRLIHNGKFMVVKHHPSIKVNSEPYDKFSQIIADERQLVMSQINTGINRGREFINTDMDNVPIILRKQGVNKLKNIFKGRPGIVVSAGPSLDKNVHLLEKAKGRAVIIAVDAAIATLLPCGILPDIVVAVEPSEKTLFMFNNTPFLEKIPLVAVSVFQTDIFRFYPGPVFINSSQGNFISSLFKESVEDKGYISIEGASVAHLAFSLAEYVGCENIALIGQDLSFNKERFHSRGFADVLDMHDMDNTFIEKDIFGEDVYTRGDLFVYKVYFERKIKKFNGTVISATEGGLPIDGAITMRFTDFIDEYCSNVGQKDILAVLSGMMNERIGYNLDNIISISTSLKKIFSEIRRDSSRIIKNIVRLTSMREKGEHDSSEFHRILDRTAILIKGVKRQELNLLVGYNYRLEFYMDKKETKDIDDIKDEWEKLDKQLERGEKYYKEIVETITAFNRKLNEMIVELKRELKVNTILLDQELEQSRKNYSVAMIYVKAGIPAQAVNHLEALINNADYLNALSKPLRNKVYVSLAAMYIRQFRFYKARELLNKVSTRQLKILKEIDALMDICTNGLNEWENREEKMMCVLEDARKNYGTHLDSGHFYFRVKDYERAESAYLKAMEDQNSESMVEACYGLAHTYLAMDDSEKAVGFLEKAIEMDPSNPLFYRDLGFIAFQNNNIEAAELFLSKAIEMSPENSEFYKPLAELYMTIGQRDAAVALYEKALRRNPDNPVIKKELAIFIKDTIRDKEIEH